MSESKPYIPDGGEEFFTHIIDNIYVGECYEPRILPNDFTDVVSVAMGCDYKIRHYLRSHCVYYMEDISTKPPDREVVDRIASWIQYLRKQPRRKVLIHCQAGQNRSPLVTAIALVRDGMAPKEAIELLRRLRGDWVLYNSAFEKFILEYWEPA